ncbi:FAD-dependent oxidoreductase [Actinacidiphila paucisporea]|uniref:Glycine/D-amino acid oxidase n=1 Tax=Actinacidiphila paucisporea TaxID=310782 RepID=A0A1M7PG55_9ACTN|nr:FAD-dependent oxidoreductase [Actinacidiphila paucisporea]SHN16003.1 Glycine/D-amino acid oxidase [Actinacidiphila paucisporea]
MTGRPGTGVGTGGARVVVVGAGVTGLLTAVECVLAGHRVTVLDRGAIPDPAATSHDQHRTLRTLAVGDVEATRRMGAAHRRWLELEPVLGAGCYRQVGVVTAWPRERLAEVTRFAAAAGVPVETVGPGTLPQLGFPAGTAGVRESRAGVLLAGRVLRAAARWLAARPAAALRPYSPVAAVDADAGKVTLAGGEVVGGDVVLVAAGPWTRELVDLPAVLHRQTMVYLRPGRGQARRWRHAPAVGGLGADGRAWVVPPVAGTLLKVSSDAVCREAADTDAGAEDQAPWAERLADAGILRDPAGYQVVAVRACHYTTDTAAGGARLARMSPAVWARTACGGSGFASAPLVAATLAAAAKEAAI